VKTARLAAWRHYGRQLAAHRGSLALFMLGSAVAALANLPVLWLIRHALDEAIPHRDLQAILVAGAAIMVLRLAAAAVSIAVARTAARRTRGIVAGIRVDLLKRLYALRWQDRAALDATRSQGRIVLDTERVELMTQGLFQQILPAIVPLILYVVVLGALSLRLLLALLLLAPLLRLLTWVSTKRLKRAIARFQQAFENFHLGTQRAIAMQPVARIQATEASALAAHTDRTLRLGDAGAGMVVAGIVNTQAGGLSTSLVAVITLVLGGIAVADGAMTTGALAAFFVAATQVNGALGGLIASVPLLLTGDEALLRLDELRAIGIADDDRGTVRPDLARALVLDAVSFGYPGRSLLNGASMRIEPGEVTVVAAPNGEGKSSLLELLLGLHRPAAGTVRLGEDDLAAIDLARYRAAIGVVPQHPLFFRDTIRANILYGREAVDDADLQRAVERAGLGPVLDGLPGGLDAPMGDDGKLLSGGESQRVAIARALVHAPRLLILDEPSNHLDAAALALLIDRLFTAPGRPTCLIATHDPRLLAVADAVYDLRSGVLVRRPVLRLATSS